MKKHKAVAENELAEKRALEVKVRCFENVVANLIVAHQVEERSRKLENTISPAQLACTQSQIVQE